MGLHQLIPAAVLTRMRFIAAGVATSLLVLLPGAVWYKAAIHTMSDSTTQELSAILKMRMVVLRQQMITELFVSIANFWNDSARDASGQIRRDLPFDFVVAFDQKRRFVDGFRIMSATKTKVALSQEAVRHLVPTDSSFFDHISDQTPSAGILVVDGRPLMIAVQKLALRGHQAGARGYALVGRFLDASWLAGNQEQAESNIEVFTLAEESSMPPDVREAIAVAQRNKGFTYDISSPGPGSLYTLLDDISDRPAVVVKEMWIQPWKTNGSLGFGIFYIASGVAGICVWAILTFNFVRSQRRVRRFDGLASLTTEHIRTLVEAFPGYAFAVKSNLHYIGVSHILAGVTGQEPSYFAGQEFGALASEWNDGTLVKVFTELREPTRWPRIDNITHVVEGLGRRHEFTGMAHYLAKQDLLLVILSQKETAQTARFSEHNSTEKFVA
jgi:CHASE4 domain